ncbi:MAG: hypothetical protein JSW61_04225 [Candidatus Thorarchaeota archaeon]|nr:MAG: hypothetical protein JSW61_04225 [Candidatus Thorarchaeota archaeon]
MLLDSELEKLAVASRQRLTQEFAEKHANLQERIRRVPIEEAKRISEKLNCPLEIAMMAFLLDMDGILSARKAVDLLVRELQRRSEIGDAVPNLPGNIQEFAISEGRWLEYNYGSFVRDVEVRVRELANLEATVDDEKQTIEKAISVLQERTKLVETFISPIVQKWINEHEKSTSLDALLAFGPPITKWKLATLVGRFTKLRTRNQAFFRRLRMTLATAEESATIGSIIESIDQIVAALESPLDQMDVRATSHFLLHIAPRPRGRGDMSRIVIVGAATTRGSKTEPDMTSPFDFLERDVKLGRRRKGKERKTYLFERIERVIRVLRHQGIDIMECVGRSVKELAERMNLENTPVDEIAAKNEQEMASTSPENRDEMAVQMVYDFVTSHIYGE